MVGTQFAHYGLTMKRLSTSAIRRIESAVRVVEASGRGMPRALSEVAANSIRMAKIGAAVDDSPDSGDPYIYAADIHSGVWDDTPAARAAIVEDADVWSPSALTAGAWVAVVRVGLHWELLGGSGGSVYARAADPASALTLGQDSEGTADDAITTPYDPLSTATTATHDGVSLWVCSRVRYNHAATTPKFYAYMTKLTWPKNIAPSVTGQTRVEVEAPEAW